MSQKVKKVSSSHGLFSSSKSIEMYDTEPIYTFLDKAKTIIICNNCDGTGIMDKFHVGYYIGQSTCSVCGGAGKYKLGEPAKRSKLLK